MVCCALSALLEYRLIAA
jgi:hypothetical protein